MHYFKFLHGIDGEAKILICWLFSDQWLQKFLAVASSGTVSSRLIRVVCFSFISLLQKRRKIRHRGMKNLKSSNQGFKCILDTTIKASLCSRHTLSWLPSSQWFYKWSSSHIPHWGKLFILFMLWMGGDIRLYSNLHLPKGHECGTRRVNHTTPFWPLWLVQGMGVWFSLCQSVSFPEIFPSWG